MSVLTKLRHRGPDHFFCVIHQRNLPSEELVWVWLESSPERACPNCVGEYEDAKFAKDVEETGCIIHCGIDGYPLAEKVGNCLKCGYPFCGDCLTGNGMCIFCCPSPKNSA